MSDIGYSAAESKFTVSLIRNATRLKLAHNSPMALKADPLLLSGSSKH